MKVDAAISRRSQTLEAVGVFEAVSVLNWSNTDKTAAQPTNKEIQQEL